MKTLISSIVIVVLVLVMVLATSSQALATAQMPDKIVYDGKEHRLHTNPMEAYFKKNPDKRPRGGMISTALWRGYVATFEFADKALVLKDIQVEVPTEPKDGVYEEKWKSAKESLVPAGQTLKIDWFTGILVIPTGDRLQYVHMGYGSTYVNYVLLEVKAGQLTGERKYDAKEYEAFKSRQFAAFKKTPEYQESHARLKTDGWSEEQIDDFLRSAIIDYTSRFLDEPEAPATRKSEKTER